MTPEYKTLAWAWVLQHSALIQGISRTHSRGTGISSEDHQQDLLIRLVEKWTSYDPDKSKPSTWVWFQSLAVRKSHVGKRAKQLKSQQFEEHHHPTQNAPQETKVFTKQIEQQATPEEWTAALAVTSGYTGQSLGEVCGCAPYSAQRRVVRLRDRIQR